MDSRYHFLAGALECRRRRDASILEACASRKLDGDLLCYVVAPLGGARGADLVFGNLAASCSTSCMQIHEAAAAMVRRDPGLKGMLLEHTSDLDERAGYEAIRAAGVLGHRELEPRLVDLVGAGGRRGWAAAHALAEMGATSAVPRLVELAGGAEAEARLPALTALMAMERPEAAACLVRAAEAELASDPPANSRSYHLLGLMLATGRPELVPWVLRLGALRAHWRDGLWGDYVCEHARAEDIRPRARDLVRGLAEARGDFGGAIAALRYFLGEDLRAEANRLAGDEEEAVRKGAEVVLDFLGKRPPGPPAQRVDPPPTPAPPADGEGPAEDVF